MRASKWWLNFACLVCVCVAPECTNNCIRPPNALLHRYVFDNLWPIDEESVDKLEVVDVKVVESDDSATPTSKQKQE